MAGAKILVIADSVSIRENVAVALAARYALQTLDSTLLGAGTMGDAAADLVIAEAGIAPQPPGRVLWVTTTAATTSARGATIRFPFRPEHLRRAVERALALPPPHANLHELQAPLIDANGVALADAASRCRLPVLICGEAGTGKQRLAHQVHEARGGGPVLTLPASRLAATRAHLDRNGPRPTLILHDFEQLDDVDGEVLRDIMLSRTTPTDRVAAPDVIALSTADPDELASAGGIVADLTFRFSALSIHLLPLRQRRAELPAIIAAVWARCAESFAPGAKRRLTASAIERLCRYPWPGNLVELEAILTRTALIRTATELTAEDLVFDIAEASSVAPEASRSISPEECADTAAPAAAAHPEVPALLHELAHELKNPMVVIKTAAQQMARSSRADPEQRDMAQLAGEAVDRMDRFVENMLEFARFNGVRPLAVHLGDLLGPALEAVSVEIRGQQIQLDDRTDATTSVWVDPSQVTYAIENLLRAALRVAGEGAPVALHNTTAGTLTIDFPASARSVAAKLSQWNDGPLLGAAIERSIPFVLARELIDRNGGRVAVRAGDGSTTVEVHLPPAGRGGER